MGSAFRLPLATGVAEVEFLHAAAAAQLPFYTAALTASAQPYHQMNWRQRICLVLGNEGSGVSSHLQASSKGQLYIPMQSQVESLNVSAAGAVMLFEAARQRGLAAV
jgi:TrmH family RNA methyltransferase